MCVCVGLHTAAVCLLPQVSHARAVVYRCFHSRLSTCPAAGTAFTCTCSCPATFPAYPAHSRFADLLLILYFVKCSRYRFFQLYYSKFPSDIAAKTVILVDPMLATGGSAIQAIQVAY